MGNLREVDSRFTRLRPMLLRRIGPILLAIVVAAPLWHIHILDRQRPPGKTEFLRIWLGARIALLHGNPYWQTVAANSALIRGLPPTAGGSASAAPLPFPAYTLVLFSFFAPWSWPAVRLVFLILLPLLTAATVPLWLRTARIALSTRNTILAMLLTLASWPVVWGIHLIQPALLVAALLAAGCYQLQRDRYGSAGVLFALATIQPLLSVPLLAWICLWALLRRQWDFLAALAATLAALLSCGTWLVHGWTSQWRAAVVNNIAWRHLRPDLEYLFGHWFGVLLAVILGAAVCITLWRGRTCSPRSSDFAAMCALALAATVCLIPSQVGLIYDHILLLPACLVLIFREPASRPAAWVRRAAIWILQLGFVAVISAAMGDLLQRPNDLWLTLPFLDFLLPTLLTLALVLNTLRPISLPWMARTELAVEAAQQ